MKHAQNLSEEEIIAAALRLPTPEGRATYLDQACGDDEPLRQRIEALLQAHDKAGEVLDNPTADVGATTLSFATGMVPMTGKPGERIGRYRILERIGEGGCGVVYVAEQTEPVRRRVALKVIKLGMDTHEVIARFEAERQALALMDHPNIAKVLDGGATESGRPFFVMELVKGVRITDYCDKNNLSTSERLGLFIQVCHAIQHAHQKGIIHRDIKPSNILVTLHDGVPVPKVIDFGIAKATSGQRLTDKTLYTAIEQFIGTPAYMSPEQAELSGLDIDTRSDIYALGVLLYELLTGKTPFDAKRLVEAGLNEIRRIISEEEPPRPSTRLSILTTEEQTTAAKRRQTDPPRLLHLVRGDLDWIVMKTLEKDRTRRYDTANGLASDIERHLNNEPVVARPPSNLYRFQKLVRRNKLGFVAGATIAVVLVLAVVVSSSQAVLARRAERQAQDEREKAKREAERADRNAQNEKLQHQRAEAAATEANMALSTSDFLQACRFIAEDRDHDACAYLVASLRANPTNDAAVTRLATLLTYRSWLTPTLTLQHADAVKSAQFSRDGKRVVTASYDNTARVWDAQTGQPLSEPFKHAGPVNCAQFSPDGKRVVTASADATARVWDAQTGQPLTKPLRHIDPVFSAQFSPDGKRVVTASYDSTARVWDAQTGEPQTEPLKHDAVVNCAQFSPDGKRVVTASDDRTARVWDAQTGQPLTEPLKHYGGVSFAQFSPDSKRVVTASDDNTARVWDARTGQPQTEPFKHDEGIASVQFSPDGKRVVTASDDKTARVWDAQTGQPQTEPLKHTGKVYSAQFSPDGKRVVTASDDKTARVWDVQTGQPQTEPLKHTGKVYSAQFSADGKRVVTASDDKTARVWDAQMGVPLTEPLKHDGRVYSAQFSPEGKRVVTASEDKTARVWDVQTGQPQAEPLKHTEEVYSAQFSPDGKRVVTASLDNTARVWDAQTGQPLTEPLKHADGVWSSLSSSDRKRVAPATYDKPTLMWIGHAAQPTTVVLHAPNRVSFAQFSPDGKRVVTASADHTARVWDARTGQPLTEALKHAGEVYSAQLSSDGRRVVTASADHTARVWDVQTGQPETEPLKHTGDVHSAQLSSDGKRVVTASDDHTARVWDARTGQPLTEPLKHDGGVSFAQFSPDGKRVVTASDDHTARVWDAQTGRPLTEPLKHTGEVHSAQFSPDGKRIVTASGDHTARVWDAQTGQPLTEPLKHADDVYSAQFSLDGKRVVTASADNTAWVWNVSPSSAGYPAWLLDLATAVCGEALSSRGVLEYTNRPLDQARRTLNEQRGDDDWFALGRWLLAEPSARTISPFSKITLAEWIEHRFNDATLSSLAKVEKLAVSTGDALLLERVSRERPALETAEAARASAASSAGLNGEFDRASDGEAASLNVLAWLFAASPRKDLRSGPISVILAERAVAATSRKDPAILGTLAAGLAEAGRFAEAVLVQREALGLLKEAKSKEDCSSRLKLYESDIPYSDAATNGLVPAVDDRLGMAYLLQARGVLCAQFAQWTLAAGDLTNATTLDPDEHGNWYKLAPLLLAIGDAGGYRKHCHAMLARFGAANAPSIAERTAKACLLLQPDGADLAAATKLAETAVTLGKDDSWAAYYAFAKGLAEYRQANFAQAVEWTRKALSQPGTDYNRDVQAYSVLAMALHRLNQASEAREASSTATELAGAKLPRLESGDLGPAWYDWIMAQTLLREAKALIEGGAKAGDGNK